MKQTYIKLLLLSVVILFLEVLLIRWIGTEINIFAYLQNAILVFCFMGLGLGCMKSNSNIGVEKSLFPLLLLTACATLPGLRTLFQKIGSNLSVLHDFVVWDYMVADGATSLYSRVFLGLAGTILLSWAIVRCMLPLGVLLGRLFEDSNSSISSYSINILGSLLGVWIFTILGLMAFSPFIWFLIFVLLYALLLWLEKKLRFIHCIGMLILVILPYQQQHFGPSIETKWSPYQKLELQKYNDEPTEYIVQVNNTGYQQIQNNASEYIATLDEQSIKLSRLSQYDIPARLFPNPKKILIVGGGTGNDVAGALRNSQAEIDVVEIDPTIIDFGRKYHPEQPYSNPRVKIIANDARDFFNSTNSKYDLIIFGLLDSHTTQAMTNARLDHYVYTAEAISQAKSILTNDGVIALLFDPQRNFIVDRLAHVLSNTFGVAPIVFKIPFSRLGWGAVCFVAGNLEMVRTQISVQPDLEAFIENNMPEPGLINLQTNFTTDNWPYLYLEKPLVPSIFYFFGVVVILLYFIFTTSLNLRLSKGLLSSSQGLQMFSLGAAFMLLETYGINQTAIIFGNTWLTNSTVISGVLVTILLANFIASNFPNLSRKLFYGLLFISCAGLYYFHFLDLVSYPLHLKILYSAGLCGLPMLFSGYIFVTLLSSYPNKSIALGSNFLGALIGGLLQVSSFSIGIKATLIIVASFYLIAFIADMLSDSKSLQKL